MTREGFPKADPQKHLPDPGAGAVPRCTQGGRPAAGRPAAPPSTLPCFRGDRHPRTHLRSQLCRRVAGGTGQRETRWASNRNLILRTSCAWLPAEDYKNQQISPKHRVLWCWPVLMTAWGDEVGNKGSVSSFRHLTGSNRPLYLPETGEFQHSWREQCFRPSSFQLLRFPLFQTSRVRIHLPKADVVSVLLFKNQHTKPHKLHKLS